MTTALAAAGVVLLVVGVALVSVPASLMTAGVVLLIGSGLLYDPGSDR